MRTCHTFVPLQMQLGDGNVTWSYDTLEKSVQDTGDCRSLVSEECLARLRIQYFNDTIYSLFLIDSSVLSSSALLRSLATGRGICAFKSQVEDHCVKNLFVFIHLVQTLQFLCIGLGLSILYSP